MPSPLPLQQCPLPDDRDLWLRRSGFWFLTLRCSCTSAARWVLLTGSSPAPPHSSHSRKTASTSTLQTPHQLPIMSIEEIADDVQDVSAFAISQHCALRSGCGESRS